MGDRDHLAVVADGGEEVADPGGGFAADPGVHLVEHQQRRARSR